MSFSDVFHQATKHQDAARNDMQLLQRECNLATAAEFKRLFPKRKLPAAPAEKIPDFAAFMKPWQERADAMIKWHQGITDEYEAALKLAALEPLPLTGGFVQLDSESGSNYATQGYGANHYARQALQQRADKAELHGLKTEVRKMSEQRVGGPYPWTVETYGLFANTTAIGWEMLKRRPDVPIRECVRLCWKRGVNPRVYYPFLPHGYEEKTGLDFFGGEIAPEGPPKGGEACAPATEKTS